MICEWKRHKHESLAVVTLLIELINFLINIIKFNEVLYIKKKKPSPKHSQMYNHNVQMGEKWLQGNICKYN